MNVATSHSVQNFNTDIDSFHVHGREVYWLCQKKQSESTFSNNAFESPQAARDLPRDEHDQETCTEVSARLMVAQPSLVRYWFPAHP